MDASEKAARRLNWLKVQMMLNGFVEDWEDTEVGHYMMARLIDAYVGDILRDDPVAFIKKLTKEAVAWNRLDDLE